VLLDLRIGGGRRLGTGRGSLRTAGSGAGLAGRSAGRGAFTGGTGGAASGRGRVVMATGRGGGSDRAAITAVGGGGADVRQSSATTSTATSAAPRQGHPRPAERDTTAVSEGP
jgi:hypothetical protein